MSAMIMLELMRAYKRVMQVLLLFTRSSCALLLFSFQAQAIMTTILSLNLTLIQPNF